MKILTVIERLVVIVAGLAALFPLYLYWQEADDRRLDRIANLISAGEICRETPAKLAADFGSPTPTKADADAEFFPDIISLRSMHDICTEIAAEISADTTVLSAERSRETLLERLGRTAE